MFEKGKNNPRWNGGNSEYPNHSEFKKNRIKVLQRTEGKCEICKEPAKIVHHIDGDKSNHSLENLIAVCFNCHDTLHCNANGRSIKGRPTKYGIKYGMTLKQIAEIFGVTITTVHHWIHKNPEKKAWMEKQLKERLNNENSN